MRHLKSVLLPEVGKCESDYHRFLQWSSTGSAFLPTRVLLSLFVPTFPISVHNWALIIQSHQTSGDADCRSSSSVHVGSKEQSRCRCFGKPENVVNGIVLFHPVLFLTIRSHSFFGSWGSLLLKPLLFDTRRPIQVLILMLTNPHYFAPQRILASRHILK